MKWFCPAVRITNARLTARTLPLLFLLALPLVTARAQQSQLDSLQSNGVATQGQDDSNCQDPTSETCVPRGAGGSGNYSTGGIGGVPSYEPRTSQPLTAPTYRDENALPNQSRYRQSEYQPIPPEPLTEFQKFVGETSGQVLPIFGARLFRQVPTTFSPTDQLPVPADAAVGPGDLLRIRIWGQVNFSADLRVDRSGEIYLPQVGPVHVAGLQYADLDAHLQTAISRVYRNFSVSAQLGQIRSIQIYVVGRARRPGTYTVSSLSSLVDALFASGGPALDGSLRHIQLKREGKLVTDFDLYDLIVNGDKSKDVRLQPGDILFIPPVGPQVALYGSVKTPAIYELRLPQTVSQLLEQAAGVTNVAGGSHLTLERMDDGVGRIATQIAMTPDGLTAPLHDGDLLHVDPTVPSYAKTVTLRGNTANPGRFAWHAGMHLSELFPDRAALLTRNYWWQRTRLGLPALEFQRDAGLDRMRQPNDPQSLPIRPEEQERLRLYQQQIALQQTERQQALLAQRSLDPLVQQQQQQAQQAQQLQLTQQGQQQQGVAPGAGSSSYSGADALGEINTASSRSAIEAVQERTADQQARVLAYGEQAPETAATARRDVITENTANASGITNVTLPAPEIDWKYAVIERLDPQTLKTSLVPFDLGRLVMDHDATQDLALEPGDIVTIFSQADIHVPIMQQTRLVRLEGEFAHAGIYSVQPGETLQQLAVRAGGFTPDAYLFGSEFTRASVRAVQQRRLDDYVQTLQLQIGRGVLATSAAAGSSPGDLASASVASSQAQDLVSRLQKIRATGRIVLNLRVDSTTATSLPTLDLEDGDTYYVPSVPASISVIGSVYNQNSFTYTRGKTVHDFVHLAGGANRDADKHHPFLIRADGSVISQDQVGEKKFERILVQPGDTIVVSEKTFGPSKLREFLNFTQIFSQLGIGAAVLTNIL